MRCCIGVRRQGEVIERPQRWHKDTGTSTRVEVAHRLAVKTQAPSLIQSPLQLQIDNLLFLRAASIELCFEFFQPGHDAGQLLLADAHVGLEVFVKQLGEFGGCGGFGGGVLRIADFHSRLAASSAALAAFSATFLGSTAPCTWSIVSPSESSSVIAVPVLKAS